MHRCFSFSFFREATLSWPTWDSSGGSKWSPAPFQKSLGTTHTTRSRTTNHQNHRLPWSNNHGIVHLVSDRWYTPHPLWHPLMCMMMFQGWCQATASLETHAILPKRGRYVPEILSDASASALPVIKLMLPLNSFDIRPFKYHGV